MLAAAARRFATLLAGVGAVTAAISLAIGLAFGSTVSRSVSVGFYLVGAFLLVCGFFIGNRGPVRLKNDIGVPLLGSRFVRWATPQEREETLNDSAIFVALGFALILIGVAADS